MTNRQEDSKTGKQSDAKKEDNTRHGRKPDPAAAPVHGADGRQSDVHGPSEGKNKIHPEAARAGERKERRREEEAG